MLMSGTLGLFMDVYVHACTKSYRSEFEQRRMCLCFSMREFVVYIYIYLFRSIHPIKLLIDTLYTRVRLLLPESPGLFQKTFSQC